MIFYATKLKKSELFLHTENKLKKMDRAFIEWDKILFSIN
ncbi:hypothetical protein I613_01340 [Listeria monocytogenes SHL005]|nr:hypothetical protein M642_03275 [Listeria monocytogenes]AHJ05617.1 hypothetical protein AX10_14180 [Listeria monocytogenes WSLC1001]EUJ20471.1 hypothetical protein G161_07949 [Listeria monocytogenes FSL F6-684]KHK10375.1 hypothetical protein I793_11695 [Listeria monocytogenes SHL001]KHK16363.1 hypothetical protein I613_01340 [Listeria monocytogenes SHL005]KHK28378.1 hypothetical protein I618_03090 [Listeria monocytogenes SHL009]KHK37951.1 hypothetical protein I622_02780 [Listeria monocytog